MYYFDEEKEDEGQGKTRGLKAFFWLSQIINFTIGVLIYVVFVAVFKRREQQLLIDQSTEEM